MAQSAGPDEATGNRQDAVYQRAAEAVAPFDGQPSRPQFSVPLFANLGLSRDCYSINRWVIFAAAEVLTKCVPIIDRLIQLVKPRDESRQHVVNDIVAPYFSELQTAYAAYLESQKNA